MDSLSEATFVRVCGRTSRFLNQPLKPCGTQTNSLQPSESLLSLDSPLGILRHAKARKHLQNPSTLWNPQGIMHTPTILKNPRRPESSPNTFQCTNP